MRSIITFSVCSRLPPQPRNGRFRFTGSGSLLTASVAYECDENYDLVGLPYNICENKRWVNPAPNCVGEDMLRYAVYVYVFNFPASFFAE